MDLLQQSEFASAAKGIGSAFSRKLTIDIVQVFLNGTQGDEEFIGCRLIRQSIVYQSQNLYLPGAQGFDQEQISLRP